jgi:hypothetical protein
LLPDFRKRLVSPAFFDPHSQPVSHSFLCRTVFVSLQTAQTPHRKYEGELASQKALFSFVKPIRPYFGYTRAPSFPCEYTHMVPRIHSQIICQLTLFLLFFVSFFCAIIDNQWNRQLKKVSKCCCQDCLFLLSSSQHA